MRILQPHFSRHRLISYLTVGSHDQEKQTTATTLTKILNTQDVAASSLLSDANREKQNKNGEHEAEPSESSRLVNLQPKTA